MKVFVTVAMTVAMGVFRDVENLAGCWWHTVTVAVAVAVVLAVAVTVKMIFGILIVAILSQMCLGH